MSNILKCILQALEAIRIESDKADWQQRLEILQLILSTIESVVADARKQAASGVRQVKQTVPVPKTRWVKQHVDVPKSAASGRQKQDSEGEGDSARLWQQQSQLATVQPNKPLPLQQ